MIRLRQLAKGRMRGMVKDRKIRKLILEIVDRIKREYEPEKIILYGSGILEVDRGQETMYIVSHLL